MQPLTPKLTKLQYVDHMQEMLGRKLTRNETKMIEPCACGQPYCSGWKTVIEPPPHRLEV